jgi:hypothetical protein
MSTGSPIGVIPEGSDRPQFTTVTAADPNFLTLLRVPVVTGRGILQTDTASAPSVALVNRAFVRKHWPDGRAIGRRFALVRTHEVVGVVDDVVELTDGTTRMRRGLVPSAAPAVYVPIEQFRMGRITFVSVRSSTAVSADTVRAVVHGVSPEVTIRRTAMLEGMVREATVETRFYAAVLALFGGVGLLLAAVGVYGVVAQSVTERMREFGVRIALGATGARLLRMVLVQTAAALAAGAAVGVATATYVTPLIESWLFGVRPNDTSTLVSVGVGFVAIGLAAAWRPASLAARADPMEALRLE